MPLGVTVTSWTSLESPPSHHTLEPMLYPAQHAHRVYLLISYRNHTAVHMVSE